MRRIGRLTQAEFSGHRGISIGSLKQIETAQGNPQVENPGKIDAIFGVEIGFVLKQKILGPPHGSQAIIGPLSTILF